jgi:hypothetical protein
MPKIVGGASHTAALFTLSATAQGIGRGGTSGLRRTQVSLSGCLGPATGRKGGISRRSKSSHEARMRELVPVIGIVLACSGCVSGPTPQPTFSQVTSQVATNSSNCRDYSAQATVDGRQQEIVGRACQQSDGTWRIVEGTSGQPEQFVTVFAPPAAYYPYYGPWLWGPPIGLSRGGPVIFVGRDHRFHPFRIPYVHNGFGFDRPHAEFGGFRGTHRG